MPSSAVAGYLIGDLLGTFLAALVMTFVVSRVLRAMFFHGIADLRRAIGPTVLTFAMVPTLIAYSEAHDGDPAWAWTFVAYGLAAACLIVIDAWRARRTTARLVNQSDQQAG